MMASLMDEKQNPAYEEVPIPPAYQSSPSSPTSLVSTTSFNTQKYPETPLPPGKYRDSVLLTIAQWRVYIRIITLFASVVSFVLIIVGLVVFEKTKSSSIAEVVDPYTGKEIYVEITTKPNVTFASIGGVNTILGAVLLVLCWRSNKISQLNNVSNAIICIIAFVTFATTMSACVYLQQNSELRATLWEWACDYRSNSDPHYQYNEICKVINVSWVFGLLQAVFDLLTILFSVSAFALLKWRLFSHHGSLGRIF